MPACWTLLQSRFSAAASGSAAQPYYIKFSDIAWHPFSLQSESHCNLVRRHQQQYLDLASSLAKAGCPSPLRQGCSSAKPTTSTSTASSCLPDTPGLSLLSHRLRSPSCSRPLLDCMSRVGPANLRHLLKGLASRSGGLAPFTFGMSHEPLAPAAGLPSLLAALHHDCWDLSRLQQVSA